MFLLPCLPGLGSGLAAGRSGKVGGIIGGMGLKALQEDEQGYGNRVSMSTIVSGQGRIKRLRTKGLHARILGSSTLTYRPIGLPLHT